MARSLGLEKGAEGKKSRVVSGMRPTGRLHIGHYFGALQNWVRLQNSTLPASQDAGLPDKKQSGPPHTGGKPGATQPDGEPAYECFYFIADWHALTSGYAVLQTADIVMYSEEDMLLVVPVDEDQVSHVELSREIVRRFNVLNGFELDEGLRKKGWAATLGEIRHGLMIRDPFPSLLEYP